VRLAKTGYFTKFNFLLLSTAAQKIYDTNTQPEHSWRTEKLCEKQHIPMVRIVERKNHLNLT
jgi:hypothetical protein